MTITVSASHVSPKWTLDAQVFALVEAGEFADHRVGGDSANGYYASAPVFGCGRHCPSPKAAIRSLLESNGCTAIQVDAGK